MSQQTNNDDELILNLNDIELSLSLPGTKTNTTTAGTKRAFSHHTPALDLHLGTLSSSSSTSSSDSLNNHTQLFSSSTSKPPPPKAQVVGWPPVRANRKNAMTMMKSGKYVKVAVDGTPYLRKVDLHMYHTYAHLLTALDSMFSCSTFPNDMKERKVMEEYMPSYEDKDGDWMLVGDVPWKMFVESCKRIRLIIKSVQATFGLCLSMASKSTGSS